MQRKHHARQGRVFQEDGSPGRNGCNSQIGLRGHSALEQDRRRHCRFRNEHSQEFIPSRASRSGSVPHGNLHFRTAAAFDFHDVRRSVSGELHGNNGFAVANWHIDVVNQIWTNPVKLGRDFCPPIGWVYRCEWMNSTVFVSADDVNYFISVRAVRQPRELTRSGLRPLPLEFDSVVLNRPTRTRSIHCCDN